MKRLEKALEHEVKLTRGKSPHYLRLLGFYFGDSNQILNDTSKLYYRDRQNGVAVC